ncbi:MAG: hypothetical protein JO060_02065, partial [Candidatus Eremiobacteraeota bacterium]|nr:hypothetical protein [Candidatus Eremiobacteraeota bacterium]
MSDGVPAFRLIASLMTIRKANTRVCAALRHILAVLVATVNPLAASGSVLASEDPNVVARQSAPTPGHLYVLDSYRAEVLRFPLKKDGLPYKFPDGVLQPAGAGTGPSGLAVGRDGRIYFVDTSNSLVDVFDHWVTGIRNASYQLLMPSGYSLMTARVDRNNYLYVANFSNSFNTSIAIYRPGAKGHNVHPVSVIAPYLERGDHPVDFSLSTTGRLYKMSDAEMVEEYNHPLNFTAVSTPDAIYLPLGPYEQYSFGFTLEIGRDDKLYIGLFPNNLLWGSADYAIRVPGSGSEDQLILTNGCGTKSPSNYGAYNFSTVILNNYLIYSCDFPTADVLVYDLRRIGRQGPVEVLGKGL